MGSSTLNFVVHFLFVLIFAAALSLVITPWFINTADRKLTRQRLVTPVATIKQKPVPKAINANAKTLSHADCLELLARISRHNTSAADALLQLPEHCPTVIQHLVAALQKLHTVQQALQMASEHVDSSESEAFLAIIQSALVHGYFVPHALDRGVVVLQETATAQDELQVAIAQSRLSARILTWIPICLTTLIIIFSSGARNSMFGTTSGVTGLLFGLVLSWSGWRWIHRLISRVHNDPLDHAALISTIEMFSISIRAGLTLSQTFERLVTLAPSSIAAQSAATAQSLQHGVPLHEAVVPLRSALGSRGAVFIDMVLSADRDGLPLVALVDRLSDEARRHRQRDIDVRIRQIPTRLTLPLVFCILPSFIVLTMFPIVTSSLRSLQMPLPHTTTTIEQLEIQ